MLDPGSRFSAKCKSQLRGREFVSVKRPHQSGTLWWGSWGGTCRNPPASQCLTTTPRPQAQPRFNANPSPNLESFNPQKPRCGFKKRPALAGKALDGGKQSV